VQSAARLLFIVGHALGTRQVFGAELERDESRVATTGESCAWLGEARRMGRNRVGKQDGAQTSVLPTGPTLTACRQATFIEAVLAGDGLAGVVRGGRRP
jgi:hypothetical protein